MKKYYYKRKPGKCPVCGNSDFAEYLFGLPAYSKEMEKDINSGKIILGGCCVTDDNPEWHCNNCKLDIYKKDK